MEKLIQVLQTRRLGILYILKVVPIDLWDWRPEKTMRTMSELANHLAMAPLRVYEGLKGYLPHEEAYITLEENNMSYNAQGLTQTYEEGLRKLISFCQKHIMDAHEKKIQFFYQTDKSSIYQKVFEEIGHEWFHLGQLYVYLRQNRVPIDMGAYYGYKDPNPSLFPNK